jgi:hypothetical protein
MSVMFIPDPELDFLPIPDPGFRGQKGTGSKIRNTVFYIIFLKNRIKKDLRTNYYTDLSHE